MHLWLLLSAALAFVPQRSVPAIRGLQAVVEDIDALSFRELQAACKERGLPARGATDVLRERLREHLADAPSDTDAIDLDAALAADDDTAFAEEELIAPDADPADDALAANDDTAFDEEELIAPDAEADDDDAFAAQLDAFFAEDDDDADDAAESARRALKAARAPGSHDSTVYGSSRAAPQSFYAHHVASISSAVVNADARTVLNASSSMSFKLSLGLPAIT